MVDPQIVEPQILKPHSLKPLAVYVHIPFCISKCHYCDFNSYQGMLNHQHEYFSALDKEIEKFSPEFKERGVETIFFGGGTPTSVDTEYLVEIISKLKIYQQCVLDGQLEVSIECNPGTVDLKKLKILRQAGFNRMSFGLQSANDDELLMLGRIHKFDQFEEAFTDARAVGFENINVDLMFGIPNQTLKSWRDTINSILKLRPEHISAYSLMIEEGTPFYEKGKARLLNLPNDEDEREMYQLAIHLFADAGYCHYEISNWSLLRKECLHNMTYWNCEEYIGLGAGAHSYLDGSRFGNVNGIVDYINSSPDSVNENEIYKINFSEQMKEFVMLGLRCMKGVSQKDFQIKFGVSVLEVFKNEINKLVGKGIIQVSENFVRLTRHGLDFANEAFMEFVG